MTITLLHCIVLLLKFSEKEKKAWTYCRNLSLKSGKTSNFTIPLRAETDSPIAEYNKFSYIPIDHLGLAKVVESLGNDDKLIVDLAYFKGLTQQEIAQQLSIPLGTVKTRARNVLIKLKKILRVN